MNTKQEIIKEYGKYDKDTGSTEVQVALMSERIDHLTEHVKRYKAKGLAWMKADEGKLNGGISKFFHDDLQIEIRNNFNINDGDILFVIGDKIKIKMILKNILFKSHIISI